ncbi:MAG: aldo/keto reductase family protein [Firmicutes bacterium]|nr:aldo/keto reductase family protein [Bacillota bacterium]
MEYRRVGHSGLKTSEIALGSWLTYGTVTERAAAIACVKEAYDLGINHFDCANVYGATPHAAEEVLADALAPYARDSYIVTTKAYWPVGNTVNHRGLSRKHIISEVDKSLKALRVDYVDIFYCHRFDPDTDLEETLRAIDDLITQGKIVYAGLSEWSADRIARGIALQRELRLHRFAASQPVYNLFNRYMEPAILPICEDAGIGQIVFSPLAQGVLTGKYKKGGALPEGSRAATERVSHFVKQYLNDELLTRVERLAEISKEADLTVAQMALAWVLRKSAVSAALIGASRPEQVRENAAASGVKLSEAMLNRIEEILTGPVVHAK